MDSNEHNKVIAFDTLFCTNHIQMLKIILSYMDNQTQKSMAIYIKFLELNYTIDYFKKHPYPLYGCTTKETSFDIIKICTELFPFCTEGEKRQLEQIKNIFQSIEMYKEMSKTMDMMKEFMPDMAEFMGDSSANNSSTNNSFMNNIFSSFFGGDNSTSSDSSNSFSFGSSSEDCSNNNGDSDNDKDNSNNDNGRFPDNGSTFVENSDDNNRDSPPPETKDGGFNMMNMLINMLTPEQKQMYEMFGGDQHVK